MSGGLLTRELKKKKSVKQCLKKLKENIAVLMTECDQKKQKQKKPPIIFPLNIDNVNKIKKSFCYADAYAFSEVYCHHANHCDIFILNRSVTVLRYVQTNGQCVSWSPKLLKWLKRLDDLPVECGKANNCWNLFPDLGHFLCSPCESLHFHKFRCLFNWE